MTIKPNLLFTLWRPDEVAECLIGSSLGEELYVKIWKCVEDLPDRYEENGEIKLKYEVPEIYDDETLAAFWDRFTDEEKTAMNRKAEEDN